MGTYRFFLAIMVALSHLGVTFWGGHNPGVVAVISFFLISGFVMTGLVRNHYSSLDRVSMFYVDRLSRILPQYLLFIALAGLGVWLLGFASPYLAALTVKGMAANLLVVPLDFFMYDADISRWMLIPQAWSLGLELTFYLLFPFIIIRRYRGVCTVLSLIVWSLAAWGWLDTDAWGYRLLPGTLFMFLLGSYIYDAPKLDRRHVAVKVWLCLAVAAWLLAEQGKLGQLYTFEVVVGLMLGVPILFGLAKLRRHPWDDRLGNMSYGVFLSHFIGIWLSEALHIEAGFYAVAFVLAVSVSMAFVGYELVESPVLRWRHRLRKSRA